MNKILSDHCKLKKIRQGAIWEVDGCWGLGVTHFKVQGESVWGDNISAEIWMTRKSQTWKDLGQEIPSRGNRTPLEGGDMVTD